MDPKIDKLVRRTTMVATCVAAYFFLTADYGPQYKALDPIKKAIQSVESSVKNFIFGTVKGSEKNEKNEKKSPEA